jgi:hypothetical protein
VHPDNPLRVEVMHQMREQGMEPPPPPFVVAPGEYTLYHEWGHHVDRTWSGDEREILFSFRWLSRFYELSVRPLRIADHGLLVDYNEMRPIESDTDATDAVMVWWQASSELFADLFEDWMRAENKVRWDQCEPNSLNASEGRGRPWVSIALLPGVHAEEVRRETYARFTAGLRFAAELPPVRPGIFGKNTEEIVNCFREVLGRVRVERSSLFG